MTQAVKKPHSLPRRMFRWCRVSALLVVLAVVSIVLWSNYVAVPEFLASPLRTELRRNNVALDFEKLRLSGVARIIAHHLSIASADATNTSRIEISEAELALHYSGVRTKPLAISGLRLNGGQLSLSINEPEQPARYFSITNLHANVEFQEGDTLRIRALSGEAFGAKADVSGVLRNFSSFRLIETPKPGTASQWRRQLREVVDIAQQLTFPTPPALTLSFNADSTNISQTRASITLRADEGASRWGNFRRLRVNSSVAPLTNEPALKAAFSFALNDLNSEVVNFSTVRINAETKWTSDMELLLTNHVSTVVSGARTKWFSAPGFVAELSSTGKKERIESRLTASATEVFSGDTELHQAVFETSVTHPLPFGPPAQFVSSVLSSVSRPPERQTQEITGAWRFKSARTKLPRAEAVSVLASGDISTKAIVAPVDPSLSFWDFLRPFDLPWQLQLSNVTAGEVQIGNLSTRGRWSFPELTVAEVNADLYKGKLAGSANLDVQTRQAVVYVETTLDYHAASVLLDPPVQVWLEQFAWESPPSIRAEVNLSLPSWTNSWQRWRPDVLPALTMNGQFAGRGSFRGIPLGLAESHFAFTNFIWTLPDLRITRPEGKALVSYTGNVTNQEIAIKLESQIDPAVLAPGFDKVLEPAFRFVKFATPPTIRADIQADLDDLKTLTARGTITGTNFFAKEQAMTDFRTDFFYKQDQIELTDLVIHRGKEEVRAPYCRIDIPSEVMWVTNALSTIDPYIAMSIVGDEAYEAIAPYRFATAPTVLVNGFVPLVDVKKANLYFSAVGSEFTFWRLHLASLAGDIHWKGNELTFSNVVADFYNGTAGWSGYFVIDRGTDQANFSFHGIATNASLQPLVRDLFATTNRLEGTLNADLIITSANTSSIETWNGYGEATLKEGYLWSIPVFGIFSPALESIAPGLGTTPISSGAGTFNITNSVIHTRDLQVRAPAFRLNYKGKVDLDGKLDARVEAQILRDAWFIGKVFSTALWPVSKAFEAQVTGKLNEPKTKFRFVPKVIFAPFKVVGAVVEAAKRKQQKDPPPSTTETPPGN